MEELPLVPTYEELIAKIEYMEGTISALRYNLARHQAELECYRETGEFGSYGV